MSKYLGETKIDIDKHLTFSKFKPTDWAMLFIERYGQIDGGHHKAWVLDQVARILNGTQINVTLARWDNGKQEYRISTSDYPSKQYEGWVQKMRGEEDENGEYEYDYDEGIAP